MWRDRLAEYVITRKVTTDLSVPDDDNEEEVGCVLECHSYVNTQVVLFSDNYYIPHTYKK